jgi:hypothetical protein
LRVTGGAAHRESPRRRCGACSRGSVSAQAESRSSKPLPNGGSRRHQKHRRGAAAR